MDDIYSERLGGALAGDVFSINEQTDTLTLNLASVSGLIKASGTLAVQALATGCITIASGGIDVSVASTTKKGAVPILSNDDTEYLDGKGNWTVPAGTSGVTHNITLAKLTGGGANGSLTIVNGLITAYTDPT